MEEKNNVASEMHASFFNRMKEAMHAGFYYEAIFLEYAAIESRLEVLCTLLGYPCMRELNNKDRRKVQISNRVNCLKKYYKVNQIETKRSKTRMDIEAWKKLTDWITKERNMYTHGLYKNPEEYLSRMERAHEVAEKGYDLAELLYKEVNRVRGILSRRTSLVSEKKRICSDMCIKERK